MCRLILFLLTLLVFSAKTVLAYRADPTPEEIAGLTRQIAGDPGNSRLLQYRGLDYAILGDKEKAIADYKAAQKISPTQHYLYWSFGWALFDLGEYNSAIQVWVNVTIQDQKEHDLGNHWVAYTLALGYWGAGDRDKAFSYFTNAAKLDGDLQTRDSFEQFTDHWTKKEQGMALQLFDAWQKEVERPGSHLW